MATLTFSDNTYSGASIEQGVLVPATFITPPTFAGISTPLAGTYVLNGSVSKVGDTVSVSETGIANPVASTAVYQGYFLSGGAAVYVFSDSILGTAFAITSTGSAVPLLAVQTLDTGAPALCFLRGTAIATPDGEVAVEDLRPGMVVTVLDNGTPRPRPLRWVGHGRTTAGTHTSLDDFPVRIRAGAIRDNTPRRDLLVTPEHCILVDGGLIPARMLVNNASITVDTSLPSFDYFHVELDHHAILLAEGLEAESYLDTGNRANFQGGPVAALRPDFATDAGHAAWATDAAAPLTVERSTVEPIWQALSHRAARLGHPAPAPAPLSDEPDLRIVTDTGLAIAPAFRDRTRFGFVVPGGARTLHLLSRASRPADTVGPFLDDRRVLGVQVGEVSVTDGRRRRDSHAHLATPVLAGWHAVEHGTRRWTNGHALLPVDLAPAEGRPVLLTLEITAAGPYLAEAAAVPGRMRA
ncbi:MAG: Hint domain-containing protein [Gluconacetobacter diazotrophicus]|nr:Hint domain-containing protein [Gluconacetobacter diazotrophicus]